MSQLSVGQGFFYIISVFEETAQAFVREMLCILYFGVV
jgi:hypothetical protein